MAVPLAEGTPPVEIALLAEQTGARVCLVGGAAADFRAPSVTHFDFDASELARSGEMGGGGGRDGDTAPCVEERPSGSDAAMLLFTSGTTGRPKAAILTHDNLAAQMRTLSPWKLGPGDTQLHALPLHHMHGIVVALLTPLLAGGAVRVLARFDARRVWAELAHATVWMGVPTMYVKLLEAFDAASDAEREAWRRAARGLRLSTSGSAALPVSVAERWRALHGAIPLERFGMTEIGMAISNPLDPAGRRPGAVGTPLPTVEVRLVDDAGRDSAHGPAELWIRGPSVFAGYFGQGSSTAAAFTDGWFRTGDVAVVEDEAYRLLGRSSVDILKTGGEKVSALEIEETLREHPDVAEIAVVGAPDETWGDRVVAFVTWRSDEIDSAGARATDAPSRADALRRWAKGRLPPFKVPKDVVALDALPRNPMGKVEKHKLLALWKELARERGAP